MGRPSEYKEEYVDLVDDYLAEHQDEDKTVKLPTLKGFARYIGVNESTIYEWDKKYPAFSKSLDQIRTEQHDRLINKGLSGAYNATLAKLILSANHNMREKTDMTSNEETIAVTGFNFVQNEGNTADNSANS